MSQKQRLLDIAAEAMAKLEALLQVADGVHPCPQMAIDAARYFVARIKDQP